MFDLYWRIIVACGGIGMLFVVITAMTGEEWALYPAGILTMLFALGVIFAFVTNGMPFWG